MNYIKFILFILKMSKFYYDVCIEYNPEQAKKGQEGNVSKVEKNWYLEYPLLEQPGNYNLSVSKFSINTESLPVFIPELLQPQLLTDINNGILKTNYSMYIKINYQLYASNKFGTYLSDTVNTYINGRYISFEGEKYKTFEKLGEPFKEGNINYVFVNNLNENCFIYNYSDFIQELQRNVELLTDEFIKKLSSTIQKYFTKKPLRIGISDDKIRFQFHKNLNDGVESQIQINSYEIGFSENFYRFIGMGFKTKKGNYTGQILGKGKTRTKEDSDLMKTNFWKLDNTCYHYFQSSTDTYYTLQQDFSTLLNWNPLKSIIIGTDTLPVVEEFLPIAHYDGFLTHYKTDGYLKYLSNNGITFNSGDNDVFKRNSLKILDVYYPLTTAPGDIRSTCILSRDNIDHGQTIELLPSSPVTRFNVWVKWVDLYGNLHDLYQGPNCCTDIRFCFMKKPVYKEDLDATSSNIVENLAPPNKKQKGEPFLVDLAKRMNKSNGQPDGIDLPGADNYGWVHL